MDDLADIFVDRTPFDPLGDVEVFITSVPGKSAVALFLDRNQRPLQLVCTKNLRAMLRRRLGPPELVEDATPSKRVDYRSLVGSVAWRRVDGEFEMDLAYIEAARRSFPAHWRQLIPDRAAQFVAINPTETYPDFSRTTSAARTGDVALFGPFADRAKADRWIELARDAFDLCRYRNILTQSPNGRACAYKQMNKCPAPCDGTIPLEQYRRGVVDAVATLRAPGDAMAAVSDAMKAHASRLEFEQAGRLKSRLATLTQLSEGANRGVRPIDEFRFVTAQPGPRRGTAKIFAISPDSIVEEFGVLDAATVPIEELCEILQATPQRQPSSWPAEVLLGTICFHLAGAKSGHRFLAARDVTPGSLALLIAEAAKAKSSTADETGEAIRETRLQQ